MLAVITKFSHNATTSMILCQLILEIIMVFGAGIFLPWKDCPKYVLGILICMYYVSIYVVLIYGGYTYTLCYYECILCV